MLPVLFLLAAAPAEVALISTPGDGTSSELRFQRPGEALRPAVARFEHEAGSTVYGALLPGTRTVVAVAQTSHPKDLTWSASLLKLEPGHEPVTLADRVALSTRPLVTRDGRVFVQRGSGEQITIDEVDPRTGKTRSIHRYDGYTAFIAAAYEREVLLYRVGPSGADLVAVHRDTSSVRTLLPRLAPMARDFATDGRALYFTTADAEGWLIASVDLKTGEPRTVTRGTHVALLPTVLPSGLAFSKGPGLGLGPLPAQGPGFERVQHLHRGLAYALHEHPGDFPTAYAVDLKTGKTLELAAPPKRRLDLAGVVE